MNLMEITKGYEPKQNEQTEQTKNLPDITDRWKQLAKEQAASLEKVTAERDELQVKYQKMSEFIQEFQERTHKLKMEKQKLFFENHEMQEEMRKSNVEIQQMTAELSEMRKLNQSLQQSNDDLRNRNGLMSRSEQELLEEEIKDVRDRNSKLQIQVNQSSVEAVEQAQQKQEEAEKQARQAEYQAERENIAWFEQLEYTSNTAGEMLFKGFFSMFMIAAGILGSVCLVWTGVEQYKKIWDDLYKMVWISSVSFVAVLGNLIRAYLPLILLLVILLINTGTILLRAYLKKKYC